MIQPKETKNKYIVCHLPISANEGMTHKYIGFLPVLCYNHLAMHGKMSVFAFFFLLFLSLSFQSCSTKDEDDSYFAQETLKKQVEDSIMYNYWTQELEPQILQNDLTIQEGLSKNIRPTSITMTASKKQQEAIFPCVKGLGSLCLLELPQSSLLSLENFCKAFCAFDDTSGFFSQGHLFFLYFFLQDFNEAYLENFKKEFNKEDFILAQDSPILQDTSIANTGFQTLKKDGKAIQEKNEADTFEADTLNEENIASQDESFLDTAQIESSEDSESPPIPVAKYQVFSSYIVGGLVKKDSSYQMTVRFFLDEYYIDVDMTMAQDKIEQITLLSFAPKESLCQEEH